MRGEPPAGGAPASNIARWDGLAWAALGAGTTEAVLALAVYDGKLFAGGRFSSAGGLGTPRLAVWDRSAWHAQGEGVGGAIRALTGYGNELVAGGMFSGAGGGRTNCIARWDGARWRELGSGMAGGELRTCVSALGVYGGELIAGGDFEFAGEALVRSIARG
ncbi:MAG: hypothetical protein AB1716_07925 [Planctomycetota bacterium]